MKVTTGTNCFPSVSHAEFYYFRYIGGNAKTKEISDLVRHKIENDEIIIGKPKIKENQELKLIDNRYHICE